MIFSIHKKFDDAFTSKKQGESPPFFNRVADSHAFACNMYICMYIHNAHVYLYACANVHMHETRVGTYTYEHIHTHAHKPAHSHSRYASLCFECAQLCIN